MKRYFIEVEIAGPHAMFTRPDTGSSFVSYPAPTFSAAKGIFESIARIKSAYIRPTKVEICRPIRYSNYSTNYGGPLRKSNQLSKSAGYQLHAMILTDVCYRLYGEVLHTEDEPDGCNSRHALQEMFLRRLVKSQHFHTMCLGWREFIPSYVGIFRPETMIEEKINEVIPSMLFSPFDQPVNGQANAVFKQNVKIENGVLDYAQ